VQHVKIPSCLVHNKLNNEPVRCDDRLQDHTAKFYYYSASQPSSDRTYQNIITLCLCLGATNCHLLSVFLNESVIVNLCSFLMFMFSKINNTILLCFNLFLLSYLNLSVSLYSLNKLFILLGSRALE
jgi:hypothetical protein